MKLSEIVDGLGRPDSQQGLFATRTLEQPGVRIGVDSSGAPGVFFEPRSHDGRRRRFVLASITYEPDLECRLDADAAQRCAVLLCTASDSTTRDLFLRVVDSWLATVPTNGTGTEVDHAVARLVDLFDVLGRPGRGEVLGLWGELFVIVVSEDPREMLRAWRCDPFERHDFVATAERLEVKTAVGMRRHQFSLEQLDCPIGTRLLVGSVVTKPSARGMSVDDLRLRLLERIDDPGLVFRIEQTIASTLGDRWSETSHQRYAADLAALTLTFYDGAMVPRVDSKLPPEVSHVRFAVELDGTTPMAHPSFPGLGALPGLKALSSGSTSE